MKLIKDSIPTFTPFNITLRVESQEDANALYAIFNHADNTNLLDFECYNIRSFLDSKCKIGGRNFGEIIANGVLYEDFYK